MTGWAAAAALILASSPARAAFDFNATAAGFGIFNFSWSAATTTANTTYTIYQQNNLNTLTPGAGASFVLSSVTDATSLSGLDAGNGSMCFRVRATNPNGFADNSTTKCHNYIHHPGLANSAVVLRADGAGGQNGFGQTWKFTYFLDDDSHVTAKIFPPGTVFTTDPATGFTTTTATNVTKTLVDNTPRSGELGGSVSNEETWDCRNGSGSVVTNGIYFLYMHLSNPLEVAVNGAPATFPTRRWEGVLTTIPVDIIRITNFTTQGINSNSSVGTINYTITGDASVRIVIARPGRTFSFDSSGDVQPLNSAGTAIDTSTSSLVQVITFNRKAGTFAETWNGTDSLGVAVSSAIYPIAISAKDGFGNTALSFSGDGGPIQTTLPVDRTASQVAGDVTPPVISAMTTDGTSLGASSGANFIASNPTLAAASWNVITITLDENPGQDVNFSTVTVTGPLGSVFGSTATSGTSITFTSTASVAVPGTYTVSLTVKDTTGNSYTPNPAPRFTISASASGGSGSTSQTTDEFKNSVTAYPNPVTSAPARLDFTLVNAATVDFDIFTLTGQRLFHQTQSFAAGAQTFNWNLVNDAAGRVAPGVYLVRITVRDGTKTVSATRKVLVKR